MASINVDSIQTAIRSWVIQGSGLAPNKVVWSLGKRVPEGTYIHLRLRFSTVGADWVNNTINPSPTSGHDVVSTVRGGRYGWLTMTCFGHDDYDSGARAPETILVDVLGAFSLPSINAMINAAKIGVLTFGDPTPVDLNIDSVTFEPRAYVMVKFHTVAELSETGAAIDAVDIEGEVQNGGSTQQLEFSVEDLLAPVFT